MGAGSAQARAAGQGRAGTRHPRHLPAAKPVPWTPWSRQLIEDLAPKALDRGNPSAKQKQALFDYALWHGQQAWVEQLARANFPPARSLTPEGDFGWVGESAMLGVQLPDWKRQQALSLRTVAALRQRHLQAYGAKNFKDILRLPDAHGPDHPTPVGATPLMLAARPAMLRWWTRCWTRAPIRAPRRIRPQRLASGRQPGDRDPVFAKSALAQLFERSRRRVSTCRSMAGWCASNIIKVSTGC